MNFPHRHKILFGIMVCVGIIVYASFNVWVYRHATSSKVLKGDSLPFKDQGKPQGVTLTPVIPANAGIQNTITPTPTPTPTSTPTPTPRPTGPGQYACSPEGACNLYGDEVRTQYCTKTYADSKCLDECGKKENQCAK